MGEPTQEIAWVFFVLGCRKMKTLSCFDDSGPMKKSVDKCLGNVENTQCKPFAI